jgi:purine nucleoside phosphorylase
MTGPAGMAIIAGSGMGCLGPSLSARLSGLETIPFDHIDGLGSCTVDGHNGEVITGRFDGGQRGHEAGRRVAVVLGRRHAYEGGTLGMALLMRWLAGHGLSCVVAVSAAGSVNAAIHPGELVIVKEIIDMQNREHLQPAFRTARTGEGQRTGEPVRERGGVGATAAVSQRLTGALESAARGAGVVLHRGSLACAPGPAYETTSEVSALQLMGVDVATMSAGPEIQYAAELGMEIAIVAAVTNRCTGVGQERPDHVRVLEVAGEMCDGLARVIMQLIENY